MSDAKAKKQEKKKKINVHAGHRERMRKRYLEEKGEGFADHELLEILLYYNITQQNTNDLAHKMLDEFGGLINLMSATPQEIVKRCHVKDTTGILVSLLLQFKKRFAQNELDLKMDFSSLSSIVQYLIPFFTGRRHEAAFAVCLDSQNRLIHTVQLSEGNANQTNIDPQQVARIALGNYASTVVIAHNHPSGDVTPSTSDLFTTRKIYTILRLMRISLADHIIISGGQYFSFAEHGELRDLDEFE